MRLKLSGKASSYLRIMTPNEVRVAQDAGFGQVYLIGFEGDENGSPTKVGFTWSIMTRLSQVQSGNWRKIVLHDLLHIEAAITPKEVKAAMRSGSDMKFKAGGVHPAEAESIVHSALIAAGLHHSREWFNGGPELISKTAKEALRAAEVPFMTTQSMRRYAASVHKVAGYR